MLGDPPIVQPEQGEELRAHTPRPQHAAPAPRPQAPEPRPRPRTLETHPLNGLEHLGLATPLEPSPAVPTLQEAEVAGNTSYLNVEPQLLNESAGGDSLADVPLPDVHLPDIPLPIVPLSGASPDGSVVKK